MSDPIRASRGLLVSSLLSGAAALIFEMVWFHRAGLVFGGSVWSTSLVLSSFMAGLTIGGAIVASRGNRIAGVLRAYALAEIAVAISGVALTYVLPQLTNAVAAVTKPAVANTWQTNVVRFVTAFAVLLVPSTAMGTTLPLLAAAVARWRSHFGSALGLTYGLNTLGAVAGVIGAEVWLIDRFGVSGSGVIAALFSLAAAGVALRLHARPEGRAYVRAGDARALESDGSRAHVRVWPLLACAFLSGAALLALEVIWFRFLTMYVLSTTLAASVMLAVVLAAIAAGGLAAAAWLKRNPLAVRHLPVVACVAGCAVAASYAAFQFLAPGTQIGAWDRMLWLAVALTFPTSLLSGVLFTLLGDALQRALAVDTRAAGWLTAANTAGAMCGPLIAAFVLLPALGMERSFFALTATYGIIGVFAWTGVFARAKARAYVLTLPARPEGRAYVLIIGGVALAGALALFPFGLMRDVYFATVAKPYTTDGAAIVATREGPSETIFLMQQHWMQEPVYSRLVTNGFSMSGTSIAAMRYMRYFVYWPMMLHRGPITRVLIVCYGVGVTAGAALDLPAAESIDVAEISPDVVAMSDVIYPAKHPLRDPRVRLHLEDGRQFLQTTSDRFDLITGEPPPPRTPGAVNIYTREYFQLIRDRLSDGGITTYWLPVGRPNPGTNVTAIVRAFCDVFEDCSLWNGTPYDLMLVGSRGNVGPVSEDAFVATWTNTALRSRLSEVGFELPQQIGATFIGDSSYLRDLAGRAPPLVDDYPQRLIPVSGRPSLSDPGYGVDPAVTELYQQVLDPARARAQFASSPFIRALWPGRIVEASLPYFDHQAILNRVMWDGGRPLQQIESLHRLLTETPLRTLPLWILGSDDVKERIARTHEDGTGAVEYARGVSALASRDYPGAAALFAASEQRGFRADPLRPLRVYALCLAGRLDEARQLAQDINASGSDQQHFWDWVRKTFAIR